VDPGQRNFDFFQANFREISIFQAISQEISIFPGKFLKNFKIFRQICDKFRFFQANFQKISIFSGNFFIFRFSRQKLLIYSYMYF